MITVFGVLVIGGILIFSITSVYSKCRIKIIDLVLRRVFNFYSNIQNYGSQVMKILLNQILFLSIISYLGIQIPPELLEGYGEVKDFFQSFNSHSFRCLTGYMFGRDSVLDVYRYQSISIYSLLLILVGFQFIWNIFATAKMERSRRRELLVGLQSPENPDQR